MESVSNLIETGKSQETYRRAKEMLELGFLASNAFYVSCTHEGHTEAYLSAMHQVAKHLNSEEGLKDERQGPVCHSGFARLTQSQPLKQLFSEALTEEKIVCLRQLEELILCGCKSA